MPESPREPTPIELYMALFGIDEAEARFIHAMESGETDGDCVEVDEDETDVAESAGSDETLT